MRECRSDLRRIAKVTSLELSLDGKQQLVAMQSRSIYKLVGKCSVEVIPCGQKLIAEPLPIHHTNTSQYKRLVHEQPVASTRVDHFSTTDEQYPIDDFSQLQDITINICPTKCTVLIWSYRV